MQNVYVKSVKYTMRGMWFLQLITQVIAVHSPRQETIGSLIMQNSGQFSNWPTERSPDLAKAKAAYNSLRSLIIKNHPISMLKTNNPFTQAQINTINDLHKKYSEIPPVPHHQNPHTTEISWESTMILHLIS
jgi:hypothetical protein